MEIRRCKNKKCNCELPIDSKKKYCDSCYTRKKEKNRHRFEILGGIVVTAGAVIGGIFLGGNGKKNKSND